MEYENISTGGWLQIKYIRTEAIDKIIESLDRRGRKFSRSKFLRSSMGRQSELLERAIRTGAPKSTGRYLSKNVKVEPGYSQSSPYARFEIFAKTEGARQYWIQREAEEGIAVDGRRFHNFIYPKAGKLLYVPVKGTKIWRMAQGYDQRRVGMGAMSLARKAGYRYTIHLPSEKRGASKRGVAGFVFGFKTKQDYKRRRWLRAGKMVTGKLIFLGMRESPQKNYAGGRYIGPAFLVRQEGITNSLTDAWNKYLAEAAKKGS